MLDSRVSTAAFLRRRAAAYRALARRAKTDAMARELRRMADEYETDAGHIAAATNTTTSPPRDGKLTAA